MRQFPWPTPLWKPTEAAIKATRKGQVYGVTLAVDPASALDRAWAKLSEELTVDGDVLLDGGAYLRRVGDAQVIAVSGGEDVLDSLSYCVNATLGEALAQVDDGAVITVVDEGKIDLED